MLKFIIQFSVYFVERNSTVLPLCAGNPKAYLNFRLIRIVIVQYSFLGLAIVLFSFLYFSCLRLYVTLLPTTRRRRDCIEDNVGG